MKYSGIGGQAVLEGIMMKNKDNYATAVRKPDGEIVVKKDTYVSMTEKVKFFSLPFVRGIFSFADSMILGMRSPTWSASFFEDDEEDEYEVECPNCGNTIYMDEDLLLEGSIECPECGETVELEVEEDGGDDQQ